MVRPGTEKKAEKRRADAVAAVQQQVMTYRAAAARFRLQRSTICDAVARAARAADGQNPGRAGRRPALREEEEELVVQLLSRYSDAGTPQSKKHAVAAFGIIIDRLPLERRNKLADFKRAYRVTMMPAVSAAGECGPPFFVFKGTTLPYRQVLGKGSVFFETYASLLPRDSIVAVHERGGGVDSDNFCKWAEHFVDSVRYLTADGRKVLLPSHGYRSHMSLRVLELLHPNNVISYALPTHTSGKTQPCDVVLFGAFKKALNESLQDVCRVGELDVLDTFDFCSLLRQAYLHTFTPKNILASFRRSGLWPVDATKLLGMQRSRSLDNVACVLSVVELEKLIEEKPVLAREGVIGKTVTIIALGYVDTRNGAVLTSEQVLTAARDKATREEQKQLREQLEANRKHLAAARREQRDRKQIERSERAKWATRARLCNIDVAQYRVNVRSMKEKRAIARLRKSLRDADSVLPTAG